MCGICGEALLRPGDELRPEVLSAMVNSLRHRGPDDAGTYLGPGVALGATRLAIIDLAGGHQPLTNENDSLWIVFNGELYNFVDLRLTLSRRGHSFSNATPLAWSTITRRPVVPSPRSTSCCTST